MRTALLIPRKNGNSRAVFRVAQTYGDAEEWSKDDPLLEVGFTSVARHSSR